MNNINNANPENEFLNFIKQIPIITRTYLGIVFVVTFLISYPVIPIVQYLILDYEMAIYKFQVWRLLTNFTVVGKFSMSFLFFLLMMHQTLVALEKKAFSNRKYSDLAMTLFYICSFLLLITFLLQNKVYLSMELLFALIYLDSKRDPEKPVSLWGFRMKSKYFLKNRRIFAICIFIP